MNVGIAEDFRAHESRQDLESASIRVLHLENNPSERLMMQAELERAGVRAEIRAVSSKGDFLAALQGGVYDVIVSGSSLPSVNNLEAMEISRSMVPAVPFIVVSGTEAQAQWPQPPGAVVSKEKISDFITALRGITHKKRPIPERILADLRWPAEAATLLTLLQDECACGILVFDPQGNIMVWSEQLSELYGLPAHEARGRAVIDVLTSLRRNGEDFLLYSVVSRIPMGWKESSHVHRQTRLPMTVRACHMPLRGEDGSPAGGIILIRDISTQKRMARAGTMVENAFRSAVESAADAILVADGEGKILFANRKFSRMSGFHRADLTVRRLGDLFDEKGRKTWMSMVPDLNRMGGIFLQERIRRADGTLFDAEIGVSFTPEKGIVATVRDISSYSKERDQLRESCEFFKSLAEHAHDVILSVSQDYQLEYVNQAFTSIMGWSKWIWLERDISSLIHPDDVALWLYNLQRIREESFPVSFHLRIRCADGRYLRGECNCSPVIKKGSVTGVWHIIRDIGDEHFPGDNSLVREFDDLSGQDAEPQELKGIL